jgi:preprotein translocase subunit YajC
MNGLTMMTLAMGNPAGGPQQGGGSVMMIGYMVIIFALFYFMMIRPQAKKEKERKKLLESIKAGDRIMFCGGMIGSVASVKEQTCVVKIADNVKIEVARGAILRILDKDEAPGDVDKNG